ncbi:MAG: hypothetical protein HY287_11635 [Planctomycetes bacterium]|nr:hypothetical protein [Planctomycetota bacterium]
MKRVISTFIVSCFALAMPISADTPVLFDFNDLSVFDGPNAISNYMTSLYGSTVNVQHTRTISDPTAPGIGNPDKMIATSIQIFDRGDFDILFPDHPITSVQFEGHVLDASPGEDFHFAAFNGDTDVFDLTRSNGEEVFDSGLIIFSQPVDHLHFSDSGRHDVGIDDLRVNAVPEPGTIFLAIIAFGALLRQGRRNFLSN